ncbi:hypothetical protein Syun_009548 [Stephania yunnanensis]|uniref:Uncharacterized protein n=1 Tax=Stephania yunnanensis TaxID=152371 RepID=A0AAP0PQR9_9MAGN
MRESIKRESTERGKITPREDSREECTEKRPSGRGLREVGDEFDRTRARESPAVFGKE